MQKLLRDRCWIFVALILICGCHKKEVPTAGNSLKYPSIEKFQSDLLDTAFDTATSIPVEPHIKTRSEWQQRVVDTCLKLDQPQRALAFIKKIDNWRRCLCYAQVAQYYAQRGCQDKARKILKLADIEYESDLQDWRSDEVRIVIAKVHLLLGETNEVHMVEAGLKEPEAGAIDSAKAVKDGRVPFKKQVEVLDGLIATGTYEAVKNALYAYTEIYHIYYHDLAKREIIGDKIRSSWKPIPTFVRFDLLNRLTELSLENKDPNKASEIIEEIQGFIDSYNWPLKHRMLMQAKLSQLRFKTGDREKAISQADAALKQFMQEQDDRLKILNIDKAEAITPLAEAYHSMGHREKAIAAYVLAVKSAVENPNSRPRAEDITDILCSMALNSVEPEENLNNEIFQHITELGEPW